jgi:hypothetical protein
MDEIELLQNRQYQIGQDLQEATTEEQRNSLIEELAEVSARLDALLVSEPYAYELVSIDRWQRDTAETLESVRPGGM